MEIESDRMSDDCTTCYLFLSKYNIDRLETNGLLRLLILPNLYRFRVSVADIKRDSQARSDERKMRSGMLIDLPVCMKL